MARTLLSADAKQQWIDEAGVYGLGKSYSADGYDGGTSLLPYFYRGTARRLVGEHDDLLVDTVAREPESVIRFSEEFELVALLRRAGDHWEINGYTFGNDISDLGLVKENGALVQLSKRIDASIARDWWAADALPSSIPIHVDLLDGETVQAQYDAALGTDYLKFTVDELLSFADQWKGTEAYDRLIVYTGAPRGFAWHDRRLALGQTLRLTIDGETILSNTLTARN
ncbi:fumarylacetoacetate hydrolase family protein [Bifidobacterium simiarum]|uniref:fumarylacetoacetate hydrolase family protein n=1 Tax=Bifidobacterium simiarum TaxID=2045441 RepID=UPI001BDC0333|nr:fumarylacetoacetate hydrolase family protein [Bifidobacterium simiarum]MBT1166655.1 hypothetical protein [Bifidobacterium simiarum]